MRLEVAEDEGCGPAILYLPGIGGTGAMARRCLRRLTAEFRTLRCRYGALERGRTSYAHLAEAVIGVMDDASIDQAVVLVESFGGGIAIRTALDHGDRVSALALVNSFARYPRRRTLAVTRMLAAGLPLPIFAWMRRRVASKAVLGGRWTPELGAAVEAVRPSFDAAYRERLRLISDLDLRRELARVRQPVALFASDGDRVVPAVGCARELASGLPDVTVEIVPDAGHLILPVDELPWPRWLGEVWHRAHSRNPNAV